MNYKKKLPPQLANYEMVEDRLKRFWEKCPNGRIDTEVINVLFDGKGVMVKAYLYEHRDDKHPVATGIALDYLGKGSFADACYTELAETSAIGRAIANSPYQSKKANRPSREEMEIALGRQQQKQKETPTQVEKQEEFDLPDPIENTPQDLIEEETLKEVEELNATETIDGWVEKAKKEYYEKMVELNPTIPKDDKRLVLQVAYHEQQTLKIGRQKFNKGVEYWIRNIRNKPYDIVEKEKGNINTNEIGIIKPEDLPPIDPLGEVGIQAEEMNFDKFPNMIKEENAKIKNTDLQATEKQANLVYTCCKKRNISNEELADWLKYHFGVSTPEKITRLECSWVLDGFFKNR